MSYLLYIVDSEDNNQPIAYAVGPAHRIARDAMIDAKCTELFAAYPDAEWIDVANITNHIASDDDAAWSILGRREFDE